MNYLAIDTSGKNLTVIIKKGEQVYKYSDPDCGVQHSVELMPRVEELLHKADFDLKNADFFACVVGAGSFTGIRIGVATVKAMCFAYSKPCLAITSFDTLAYNKKGGKVLALIDAKHNGFYACGYDNGKVTLEPSYLMREQVEKIVLDYDKAVAIADINGFNIEIVSVVDGFEKAIESKLDEISLDIEKLKPLYVRKSQAEEGR
ncbi:MAG: tRNA (adenosine(37)-N6)-threonylcarbamoyltransferase complex dimerization subunit type 1 TsaB [Clostridia bacterium]|nr:tRNA (adenosine(37)-N6)-threonylcarbamoyltransferase complex dimerization subunit type 1 TsaB [Clostridia bacterium]